MKLSDLYAANRIEDERSRLRGQMANVERDLFEVSINCSNLPHAAKAAIKQALLDHLARQVQATEDRLEALDVVVDD